MRGLADGTPDIRRVCLRFLLAVAIAATVPLTPVANAAGAYVRGLARAFFSQKPGLREVAFYRVNERETKIEVINKALLNRDGSGPVREALFSTSNLFLTPVLVFLALVAATPSTWGARLRTTLLGLTLFHILLIFLLWHVIRLEGSVLGLETWSEAERGTWQTLSWAIQDQFRICLPLLIWLPFGHGRVFAAQSK